MPSIPFLFGFVAAPEATPSPLQSSPIDVSAIHVFRISPDLLNLAVVIVFVVLFLRTASPLLHSRYLRHLALAYGLIGLFYLSSIILVQYELTLSFLAQCQKQQMQGLLNDLKKVGELIKLIFSSLSSCFLLLTWYLLWHHPKEGISSKFYGSLFTAYCVAIPAIVGLAAVFQWPALNVLNVTDSIFALIGVVMVALGLCRLLLTVKTLSRPIRDLAIVFVGLTFIFWAIFQPLYVSHQDKLWFWYVLASGKMAAGLSTLLVSVGALKTKPEFRSPSGGTE